MRLRYYRCSCCNKQNHNMRTCDRRLEFIKEFLDVWKEKLEIKIDKEEEK